MVGYGGAASESGQMPPEEDRAGMDCFSGSDRAVAFPMADEAKVSGFC